MADLYGGGMKRLGSRLVRDSAGKARHTGNPGLIGISIYSDPTDKSIQSGAPVLVQVVAFCCRKQLPINYRA